MSAMQRNGLSNSLIHWVHRHDRMATLFRSSLPGVQHSSYPARRIVSAWEAPVFETPPQESIHEEVATESMAEFLKTENPGNSPTVQLARAEVPQSSREASTHKPLPAKSSALQPGTQKEDPEWRRLQAILRKHEEQAETDLPSGPQSEPTDQDAALNNTQPVPVEKIESPKLQQPRPRAMAAVYRKNAARIDTRQVDVSTVKRSSTDSVPPIQPGSSSKVEQPEHSQNGLQTIQRKSQESAEPKPVAVPKGTTSPAAAPKLAPKAQEKEYPNLQQQVWNGFRSIFRKHQESSEAKKESSQGPTSPTLDSSEEEFMQQPDAAGANLTDEMHPLQKETAERQQGSQQVQASKSTALSAKSVQRSAETIDIPKQPHAMTIRSQSEPSLSPADHSQSTPFDEPPAMDQIQRQTIPLQSAWNVQRIDVEESPTDKPSVALKSSPLYRDEAANFDEFDQDAKPEVGAEAIQFDHQLQPGLDENSLVQSNDLLSGSSQTPVEILSPSRPRPTQASVTPSNPTVQRQPEKKKLATDVKEPALVDTAIGPLPSDLWTLLGQKPPTIINQSTSQPPASESHANESFRQAEALTPGQRSKPAEVRVHEVRLRDAIQRAPASTDLSTSSSPEQAEAAQDKKSSAIESDINDLAHKVYEQVRHRLAMEWERMRR